MFLLPEREPRFGGSLSELLKRDTWRSFYYSLAHLLRINGLCTSPFFMDATSVQTRDKGTNGQV